MEYKLHTLSRDKEQLQTKVRQLEIAVKTVDDFDDLDDF